MAIIVAAKNEQLKQTSTGAGFHRIQKRLKSIGVVK
jgi:hypothetical protein